MTQKEFIIWLQGYLEGRKTTLDTHQTGYDVIEVIQKKMSELGQTSLIFEGYETTTT